MSIKTKNIKTIILSSIVIIIGIFCFATNISKTKAANGFTYTILEDGTAEITGYNGSLPATLVIPNEIDGYTVTSIGKKAFYFKTGITTVTIPSSVKELKEGAFWYCSNIKKVTLNEGLEMIGKSTFIGNSSLTQINIPNTVISIGESAFSDCKKLTSITLPNGITEIKAGTFSNCTGLMTLPINNNIISIGDSAFLGCSTITSVYIPATLENIGNGIFNGCAKLTAITVAPDNLNYTSEDGVLFNKSKEILMSYPAGKTDSSYEIPIGTKKIADWSFYKCNNLTNIIVPNTLTSIGEFAFRQASNLTTINLPNSIMSIEKYAFQSCKVLNNIVLPSNITIINEGTFFGCSGLTSIIISENIVEIRTEAFRGCTSLINVVLYEGLKNIGNTAFYGCESLNSIIIPESVDSLGSGAFSGCKSLPSITIPDGITVIDSTTFDDCTNLASIIIPESVTNIGYSAFENCSKLETVLIPGNDIRIGSSAFKNCSALKNLTFLKTVQSISEYAFENCSNLSNININELLWEVESNAFKNCTSLTDLKLMFKAGMHYEINAFQGCSNLNIIMHGSQYDFDYRSVDFNRNLGNKTLIFEAHSYNIKSENENTVKVFPTCTAGGSYWYMCECGQNAKDDIYCQINGTGFYDVDELGHLKSEEYTYEDVSYSGYILIDGKRYKTCARCGLKFAPEGKLEIKFDEGVNSINGYNKEYYPISGNFWIRENDEYEDIQLTPIIKSGYLFDKWEIKALGNSYQYYLIDLESEILSVPIRDPIVLTLKTKQDPNFIPNTSTSNSNPEPEPSPTVALIYGYLKDENGNPIANAEIELHSNPRYTITDKNGYFEFKDVEVGNHTLYISYDNSDICEVNINILEDNDSNSSKAQAIPILVDDKYTFNAEILNYEIALNIDGVKEKESNPEDNILEDESQNPILPDESTDIETTEPNPLDEAVKTKDSKSTVLLYFISIISSIVSLGCVVKQK